MIRFFISIFIFLSFFTAVVFAHPPSNIELSYDKDNSTLHIHMRHVTRNVRKHFIREIIVYKNDKEIDSVRIISQTSPTEQEINVAVPAEGNDILSIKAICSKGGIGTDSIKIPEDEDSKEGGEENAKDMGGDASSG